MGLKFVSSDSVVVDCYAARHNGMQWTLVNNLTMERIDCETGIYAVDKLRYACPSVQTYLDALHKANAPEKEPKKDDGYVERTCHVSVDDAPALLNLLDASGHVTHWRATRSAVLSRKDCVVIQLDYTSDRQLLFQEDGKVVFRDEEPAPPAAPATPAHAGEGA